MRQSSLLSTWLKPLVTVGSMFFLAISTCSAQSAPATANTNVEAFPEAKEGYQKHIIHLPIGSYENNLKVELLPGKVQEVDCNTQQYNGKFEEKILEGWGYTYYELSDVAGPVSTLMACPEDKKSLQFVPVHSNGSLLQYNSRLPVVVYLPTGFELRWRTWVATPYITAPAN